MGNGRVAIPVALETGRRVIGVDSSPAMLAQARVRAEQAGADLELREGDMRDLALDEPARSSTAPSARYCTCRPGTTSGGSSSASRRASQPGGRFAWNVFCFDHTIAARGSTGTIDQDDPVPSTIRQCARETTASTSSCDAGRAAISLWWATKSEWEGLIDVAGLEVEALYGWFDRRPFDDESRSSCG